MPLPYILWTLEPDKHDPGRLTKKPMSFGGRLINPHDPANHHYDVSYETACWYSSQVPRSNGVGTVIIEGYFLIDLDHACTNGVWSPLAHEILARFPKAYIEVSQSGTGLHIIGRCTIEPHHNTRGDGIEFYSRKRFVALTGKQASGTWETDYTAEVLALVNEKLGWKDPTAASDKGVWTTEAIEGAAGAAWSDEVLLDKAMRSKSMASVMRDDRCTFRELWERDEEALGKAFPVKTAGDTRPYDYSEADLSLAVRLMYFTGKNCERVHNFMWQSALVRPKWDRLEYMQETVLEAYKRQTNIAIERPKPSALTPAEAQAAAPAGTFLVQSDYDLFFDGCVWVEDRELVAVPGGKLLNKSQFDNNFRYGGRRFMLDEQKVTRSPWEAFNHSAGYQHASAHTICFRPEHPPMALVNDNGRTMLNTFVPKCPPHEPGDVKPMLDHLGKLLPVRNDYEILLCYLAGLVKHPGEKFTWWPMLVGVEGNGKSFIGTVMSYCVGDEYTHLVDAQDLANKFNGWMDRKTLAIVEEIAVRDRLDLWDALKPLITNPRIQIQAKGRDQVTGDNRVNGLLFSNHPDAIRKTPNDRRVATFYTAQREASDLIRDGMDAAYFERLWGWFKAGGGAYFLDYLLSYQIPDHMNPAVGSKRAPVTSTTHEIIEASRTVPEQLILEAIGAGQVGFRGGFVSSTYVKALLLENRIRMSPARWTEVLGAIGYVRHPALHNGRLNNPVQPDNCRPTIFVLRDTIQGQAANYASPAEVADRYARAQQADPAAQAVFGGQVTGAA